MERDPADLSDVDPALFTLEPIRVLPRSARWVESATDFCVWASGLAAATELLDMYPVDELLEAADQWDLIEGDSPEAVMAHLARQVTVCLDAGLTLTQTASLFSTTLDRVAYVATEGTMSGAALHQLECLLRDGVDSYAACARQLGLHPSTVRNWSLRFGTSPRGEFTSEDRGALRRRALYLYVERDMPAAGVVSELRAERWVGADDLKVATLYQWASRDAA